MLRLPAHLPRADRRLLRTSRTCEIGKTRELSEDALLLQSLSLISSLPLKWVVGSFLAVKPPAVQAPALSSSCSTADTRSHPPMG